MSITYDSIIQDEIALLVGGRSHGSLTSDQQKLIDNAWSAGALAGGAAKRAQDSIATWAEFFTMDSTAGIPDEWRSWFVLQAAAGCAQRFSTADEREIRTELSSARRDALMSFTRSNPEDTDGTDQLLNSVLSIRQFVVSNCLRLAKPVLPEPSMIDSAMQEVLRDTWNAADWSFRKQTVTLTIGTDSSVTVSGGLIIKRITSDRIFYTSTSHKGMVMIPVDTETMLTHQTRELSSNRPEMYRLLADAGGADGGIRFEFERTPDQEYTAKCEAVTSIGPMTTLAQVGTVISSFPVDMGSYLKKKTLATVLENVAQPSAARPLEFECDEMLTDLMIQESPLSDAPADEHRQYRRGLGSAPSQIGGFV